MSEPHHIFRSIKVNRVRSYWIIEAEIDGQDYTFKKLDNLHPPFVANEDYEGWVFGDLPVKPYFNALLDSCLLLYKPHELQPK